MGSALHTDNTDVSEKVRARSKLLYNERYAELARRIDRTMARLMLATWAASIGVAVWISPLAWAGKESVIHAHVYAAIFLGGLITVVPVALTRLRPGSQETRYVMACAQMLWSALLIHLSGGHIETHFHIFGSLAIIAFYRDFKVLIPATILMSGEHFLRGIYWPESVYGVSNPQWWLFLEHAGWIVFIVIFLILNCAQAKRDLVTMCIQQAQLESAQEKRVKMERLAAVGQLAASVGHELRNPLAAIANAKTFVLRRLTKDADGIDNVDPKVLKFMHLMQRELDASFSIISDLLDFSRAREPVLRPCPLRPLVADAMSIVPHQETVVFENGVAEDFPIPELDREQLRQVLVNLLQNGSEAASERAEGKVVITTEGSAIGPWVLRVKDNGCGMSPDVRAQAFEPLFSTKTKGTGLGLAVVAEIIKRHRGTIVINSVEGVGSEFVIHFPSMGGLH